MAKILKVTIEKIDGNVSMYSVLPKTMVAFEREYKCGLGVISTDRRMEHIYWLAWDASRTAGAVVKPFGEWLNEIADVEIENEAGPLEPEPSPAS